LQNTKKYSIIYCDPPWKYSVFSDRPPCARKAEEEYYEVADLIDLVKLPMAELAEDNCVLFLWATYPALPIALKLIKEWGFHYRTVAFTWVKRNKKADSWFWGMGGWTRANAEICLLATRGNPKRASRAVHSILDDRIMKHSEKPDTARQRIVELMGDLPRIELFSRQKVEGWTSLGLDIDGCDIQTSLDKLTSV